MNWEFVAFGVFAIAVIGVLSVMASSLLAPTKRSAAARPGDNNYIAEMLGDIKDMRKWAEKQRELTFVLNKTSLGYNPILPGERIFTKGELAQLKKQHQPPGRINQMDWINFAFFEKFKNDNAITEKDHFVFIVKHSDIGEAFPLVWRLVELEAFRSQYEIFEFTPLPTVPRKYTHPTEFELEAEEA